MKYFTNRLANVLMLSGLFIGLIGYSYSKTVLDNSSLTNNYSSIALPLQNLSLNINDLTQHNLLDHQILFDQPKTVDLDSQNVVPAPSLSQKAGKDVSNDHLHKILNDSTHRSRFQFVLNKLKESNLPKELVLIPVIESEYNMKAVSNKGAGGPWQLMPQTAKGLGIKPSQRFELAHSTKAALAYFKQLYKQFNNLEFAVAAYNAGEGRVQKALDKNPNAKSVQELKLPLETRNYVKSFYRLQHELKSYQV